MIRAEELIEKTLKAGFARAVLLRAEPLSAYAPNEEAVRQRMEPDPGQLLPGAKSVLVAAMPFEWYEEWPTGYGEIAAFYPVSSRAYLAMRALAEEIRANGAKADVSQRTPSKLWGARGGLGVQGRNTLLRNEVWGSCFALQTMITDVEPLHEATQTQCPDDVCGDCRRCVDACPTGALDGHGGLDPDKCLRTWQLRGEMMPEVLRVKQGMRLLGCEICQRVCPYNAGVKKVPPETAPFQLEALLRFDKETREQIGGLLGRNEARPQRMRAQALIAAGNSGDETLLPAVEALLTSQAPTVAEHARWAHEFLCRRNKK